ERPAAAGPHQAHLGELLVRQELKLDGEDAEEQVQVGVHGRGCLGGGLLGPECRTPVGRLQAPTLLALARLSYSDQAMLSTEALRQVRRWQLRSRRAVVILLGGEYHSAFKGSGLAFADVRPYQPGDDVRAIDWNVTARSGQPFLKRFTEERELTVLFAVD